MLGLEGLAAVGDAEARARGIAHLVEALAEVDLEILRADGGRTIPRLYASPSPVRYEDSPRTWADVGTLLRIGRGDCKSLVAWRIAELRLAGESAGARVAIYVDGTMHVEVARRDGGLEDPSALVGR